MSKYLKQFAAAREVVLPCLYLPPGTELPADAELRPHDADTKAKRLSRLQLRVSAATLPGVERAVIMACTHLRVPRNAVHAFVSPDAGQQAYCYNNADEPVIVFGSALIELMSEIELACVAGHEIGHFLLPESHFLIDKESIVGRLHSRAAELTMDRIGLLACQDLPAACRTDMKLMCGLKEPHLRPDVSAFLDEARKAFDGSIIRDEADTHPPAQLRLRAIIEFANSDAYLGPQGKSGGKPVAEVNQAISRLMHEHLDRHVLAEINEPVLMAKAWLYCLCKCHGTDISVQTLNKIKPEVEDNRLAKAWASLAGFQGDQIAEHAQRRFTSSLQNSHSMSPALTELLLVWMKNEPSLRRIHHLFNH